MLTRTLSLRASALLAGLALVACGTTTTPVEDTGLGPDTGPPPGTDAGGPIMDSGPAPVCDPGAMQIGECGFCGSQAQECDSAGQWASTTECIGEGECAFGTAETRDLALCGQQVRLCLDGCVWGDWAEVRPAGECEAGDTRFNREPCPLGEAQTEECGDTCAWEVTGGCADPCGGAARTTPEWRREVCVPAGPFVRGGDAYPDWAEVQPVAEVYVSSFYIDAYPVTNRRYADCVAAGACASTGFTGAAWLDYPVQRVSRARAEVFCAWDGRRLPTEAEWEKAARGPAPRTNDYPWGDGWDCTAVPSSRECGTVLVGFLFRYASFPYDGLPGSQSYYGTFLQVGGVYEHTADWYSSSFYSQPSSLIDPLATEADALASEGIARGTSRGAMGYDPAFQHLVWRRRESSNSDEWGVRCARDAP